MGGVLCESEWKSRVDLAARYNSTAAEAAMCRLYGGVNQDYSGENTLSQ